MNRTIAAILALAGVGGALNADSARDVESIRRFREQQKRQPRTAGTMRRSSALIDIEMGYIRRGTRAKSRGPYPQHMIANCKKMAARKFGPIRLIDGAKYRASELRLKPHVADVETVEFTFRSDK